MRLLDLKKKLRKDKLELSAQESIPFERMFQDGICRVGTDYYTKTIQFQDINYQLAQNEDKTEIFEEWCAFLNFFDSSVHFELSFMNMATDSESFAKSIAITHNEDGFNDVRDEYSRMLLRQMDSGNNGLTKTKYLTFGIHAESMRTAKPRLMHIELDLLNNFKRLGVMAQTLNGYERLELMHKQFHMYDDEKFIFEWKELVGRG
ncbi:MAG: conjugal transfer protein TraE, partial [Bacteroidaceae bacterium]|nr:conjugal transfer protein TraE [Bacteroidaceae bacterium]